MAAGRFLFTLAFVAVGLFAAALIVSAGKGSTFGLAVGEIASLSGWMPSAATASTEGGRLARSEGFALLIGFVAGWWLRWLYGLPWSAIPAAIGRWLLGWRASAAMAGLALGCTVILLFY